MMKKMAFESKYVTAGEDFPQRRRRLRFFEWNFDRVVRTCFREDKMVQKF